MLTKTEFHTYNGKQYPIGLMTADTFDKTKLVSLMCFCHGMGEKGDGSLAALSSVTGFLNSSPLPANCIKNNFILIYTQIRTNEGAWTVDYIDAMLDYAKQFLIDFKVLTGASLGGGAVWMHASAKPGLFNAYIPVCPVYGMYNAKGIALSGSHVWAWHAIDDTPAVPAETTKTAIALIKAENPTGDIRLTLYPSGGHYIWNRVYDEIILWQWLTAFRSKSPLPPTNTTPAPTPTVTDLKAIAEVKEITTNSAVLDGSKSTGNPNYYIWEGVKFPEGARQDVYPGGWNKGGPIIKVSNLIAGYYLFNLKIGRDGKEVYAPVSFTIPPLVQSPVFVEIPIPAGKTKVIVKEDKTYEFV